MGQCQYARFLKNFISIHSSAPEISSDEDGIQIEMGTKKTKSLASKIRIMIFLSIAYSANIGGTGESDTIVSCLYVMKNISFL